MATEQWIEDFKRVDRAHRKELGLEGLSSPVDNIAYVLSSITDELQNVERFLENVTREVRGIQLLLEEVRKERGDRKCPSKGP